MAMGVMVLQLIYNKNRKPEKSNKKTLHAKPLAAESADRGLDVQSCSSALAENFG
jgi:hypothetical protein